MPLLSPALAEAPPLAHLANGIEARLQAGFPAAYFDVAWMPAKPDRRWFERTLRRTALLGLGWEGTSASGGGQVFQGMANFALAIIVKNPDVKSRYFGDALSPGIFAMTRVATILLNGFLVRSPDRAWCATGSLKVTEIENTFSEDWGDENAAIAALRISTVYEEDLPPGLDEDPGASLNLNMLWNFGEQPPLLETETTLGGV